MRLGIVLDPATGLERAVEADELGLAFVVVPGGALGEGIALAAAVAARTRDTRIVVHTPLGTEHPTTIAEELSVVDHVSGGRVVALLDTCDLSVEAAAEDVGLLRQAWSGRWVTHSGPRWTVPARIHGDDSPHAVSVTPWPAQLELPVWLTGEAAADLGASERLPVLVDAMPAGEVDRTRILPARAALTGELDADRSLVLAWADAGVSHLALRLPEAFERDELEQLVARYLVPEAATPTFPRIIAESAWPAEWRG